MALHEAPICFRCHERVLNDPVFAAICDHDDCPSVVFHPMCLMQHRDHWREARRARSQFYEHHRVFVMVEEIDPDAAQ